MIYDENKTIVAKGTAEWVAQNMETGFFMKMTPELLAPFDPEPEEILFPGFSFPAIRKIDVDVDLQQEIEIERMMFDYNGHVHNSIYVHLAEQILPEELYYHRFNDVEIIYKLEITSCGKVLLEYTKQEDRHMVVVRRKDDRAIHAVVYFSDVSL